MSVEEHNLFNLMMFKNTASIFMKRNKILLLGLYIDLELNVILHLSFPTFPEEDSYFSQKAHWVLNLVPLNGIIYPCYGFWTKEFHFSANLLRSQWWFEV